MTTPDADLRKVQKLLTLILAELDRVCRRIGVSYAVYGGTAIGAIRHGGFIPWDDDIDVMMTRADYERFLAEAPALLDERFRLDNTRTREDFPFMFTKMVLPGTLLIPEADKDSKYRMPFFLDILPLDEIPADDKAFKEMSRQSWLWGRLLFLQGTPRPHLINTPAWKKALIFSATTVAHLGLKAVRGHAAQPTGPLGEGGSPLRGHGHGRVRGLHDAPTRKTGRARGGVFPTIDVPFEDITVMIQHEYDSLLRAGYGDYMQLPPPEKRYNHEAAVIDFGPYADSL